MSFSATIIESKNSSYPAALRDLDLREAFPRIWVIGNLEILARWLLGFFCSIRCPGQVILETYDLARALRDAGVSVIGGFHSPMEKECLDLLLRGQQPVVVCPARGIERMRLPVTWRTALYEDRLLVLSPFEGKHRRPTADLAAQRNRLVAGLADEVFVAHATIGSKTERLFFEVLNQGKRTYTLKNEENARLAESGALQGSVSDLIQMISSKRGGK